MAAADFHACAEIFSFKSEFQEIPYGILGDRRTFFSFF